ncbi:MAG: hypothetical protein WEB06_01760 [Actinomycetota bacterium]
MPDEETKTNISRRQLIKRGAIVGGAAIWVPPVVQSMRMPAFAQVVGSPPPVTCIIDGFMTGGGAVEAFDLDYELHKLNCPGQPSNQSPHLVANWDDNEFVVTSYTSITCSDNLGIPNGANADFDTISGTAVGTLNGVPGATAQFEFVDAGEGQPPNGDIVTLVISDANNVVVLSVMNQLIDKRNQQAHGGMEAEGRACP